MQSHIVLRWDESCGITLGDLYNYQDSILSVLDQHNYGDVIQTAIICFVCVQDNIPTQIRYEKAKNCLTIKIVFDFNDLRNCSNDMRKQLFEQSLMNQLRERLSKKYIEGFNSKLFVETMRTAIETKSVSQIDNKVEPTVSDSSPTLEKIILEIPEVLSNLNSPGNEQYLQEFIGKLEAYQIKFEEKKWNTSVIRNLLADCRRILHEPRQDRRTRKRP